jgi:hypothetical protein
MESLMFAARASRPVTPVFPAWGIFVLESHHGSDFKMPTTAHDFLKIKFVLGGQGAVTTKTSAYPLHKNDVIVVSSGFAHRIEDDANRALALIVLCVRRPVLQLLPGAVLRDDDDRADAPVAGSGAAPAGGRRRTRRAV